MVSDLEVLCPNALPCIEGLVRPLWKEAHDSSSGPAPGPHAHRIVISCAAPEVSEEWMEVFASAAREVARARELVMTGRRIRWMAKAQIERPGQPPTDD